MKIKFIAIKGLNPLYPSEYIITEKNEPTLENGVDYAKNKKEADKKVAFQNNLEI